MRILLLIIQFPPDVNSTGLLMSQIADGLQHRGHEVSVITTFPHYEKFQVWEEYRGKLYERSHFNGFDVLRLFVYASGSKQNMLRRLASYLSFNALATTAGVLSREEFDVILCTNGSFFTGVSSSVIGRRHGIPFVYNVQDLYPETPIKAGQLNNGPAVKVLRKIERFMYAQAAQVTVISPSFRESLLSKGVPDDRITVIPNFVDTEFIRPLAKDNVFSQRHGLADKFVVSHAGNLGFAYDLDTMLDAAALLRSEDDILFLIVGDGVAKPDLERKAEELQLSNVRFMPFQPYAELPWLRAASDVQVSLNKATSADHSLPSKVYEIMASGRPLLASASVGSDVWNLAKTTGCGISVVPEEPEQLTEAVLTLYQDPELRHAMGERGRQHAQQNYSKEVIVDRYDELLQRVAAMPDP